MTKRKTPSSRTRTAMWKRGQDQRLWDNLERASIIATVHQVSNLFDNFKPAFKAGAQMACEEIKYRLEQKFRAFKRDD